MSQEFERPVTCPGCKNTSKRKAIAFERNGGTGELAMCGRCGYVCKYDPEKRELVELTREEEVRLSHDREAMQAILQAHQFIRMRQMVRHQNN